MPEATTQTVDATTATTATDKTANTTNGNVDPWYKDWLHSDGTINVKSYDRLPDHLKGLKPTLERQNSVEGVLQALDHAQTLAGKKALAPLAPDATEAAKTERKALLDAINAVPKEAKDYAIAKPADLPDAAWNPGLVGDFTGWAHKHSVSPAAAKELIALVSSGPNGTKAQLGLQAKNEEAFWSNEQKIFEGRVQALGKPLDSANGLVEKGAIAFGMDLANEHTKVFLKGAQARLMCLQHAISIGEDSAATPGGQGTGSGGGDIDQRIKEARADPAYGNWENKYSRADHETAVNRVNELLRIKVGKKK